MADLAELLVLLHGARDRVSTVRAEVRTWRHLRLGHEAMARAARATGGGFAAYGPVDEPPREAVESGIRLWLAPPDRVREEREDPSGRWYGVRRGGSWWRYDPANGALSNEDEPDARSGLGEELGWLLDPAPLIGALDFGETSAGRRAGRPTLCVSATPRNVEDTPLFRIGAWGADELHLEVDAERGTLLRAEARFEGQPFARTEVLEIGFDEAFPDDTFVFRPPPGEQVRSFSQQHPIQHDLTIEQAVGLAPFTVWIPARLPAGWESQIAFAAEHARPPMAAQVFLHYRAPDGTHTLGIAESRADGAIDHEAEGPGGAWQPTSRRDRSMEVREPAEHWQQAQVRLELDGTRILIHSSDLDADALADVAAGLVRAPAEPPDLRAG